MFALPELPFAYNALEPVISDRTLRFHHDKHHAAYVNTLNALLKAAGKTPETLESLILETARSDERKLFNNAAQAWNHSFFWASMSAERQTPSDTLAAAIAGAFGGLDKLKEAFVAEGVGQFGSGWVWLAADSAGALSVVTSHDAETLALGRQGTPLLVADVWEHAYYIDTRNDRKGFLTAWFGKLANWEFAAKQYTAAKSGAGAWAYPETAAA